LEGFQVAEFVVWAVREKEGDGGDPIEADSPGEAAEIWAAEVDRQAGNEIAKKMDSPVVNVRDEFGVLTRWKINGDLIPDYNAVGLVITD
jgi:hypothetical protein